MREIKFRVWSEVLKRFYKQEYIGEEVWCDENGIYWPDTNLQIWQQYTGLKDKNGVEIYEGDIVKLYYQQLGMRGEKGQFISMVGSGNEELFPREDIVEVKFKTDKNSVTLDLSYYLNEHFMARKDSLIFEVIGNILENPELLK